MKKYFFVITFLLLCLSARAATDLPFLDVSTDGRSCGLGSSVMAGSSGIESLQWNPAGISRLDRFEMLLTYSLWITSLQYFHFAAGGLPLKFAPSVRVGMDATWFDSGTIISESDTLRCYNLAFGLGYGAAVGRFRFGNTIRLVLSRYYSDALFTGLTVNSGVQYDISRSFSLGLVMRNAGFETGEGSTEAVRPSYEFGGRWEQLFAKQRFFLSAAVGLLDEGLSVVSAGAEYGLLESYFARIGLRYHLDRGTDGLTGEGKLLEVNYGIGVRFNRFIVDVAMCPSEFENFYIVTLKAKI